jgi:NTP pyrophosphatase (non-canonical NTP hydrolase)
MSALKITQVGEIIQVEIEGKADGLLTYLSQAEFEMVQDFRREQETMKTENNSISSTEQAVRDIQRLRDYLKKQNINFKSSPVDNAIECLVHRLNLIKESRLDIKEIESINDLNVYQDAAAKTAIYPGKGTALGLIYCALKLSGEAGEVADNVGKALRDDEWIELFTAQDTKFNTYNMTFDRVDKIKLELGDVLWYVSQAAKELGFTLEEIAQANLDKLAARKDNGTLKGSGDDR